MIHTYLLSVYLLSGTIGIDLERKLIMHAEKDANIWKAPEIDREEAQEIKKFASPSHQVHIDQLHT